MENQMTPAFIDWSKVNIKVKDENTTKITTIDAYDPTHYRYNPNTKKVEYIPKGGRRQGSFFGKLKAKKEYGNIFKEGTESHGIINNAHELLYNCYGQEPDEMVKRTGMSASTLYNKLDKAKKDLNRIVQNSTITHKDRKQAEGLQDKLQWAMNKLDKRNGRMSAENRQSGRYREVSTYRRETGMKDSQCTPAFIGYTADAYNKANYKWDPNLKKVVYQKQGGNVGNSAQPTKATNKGGLGAYYADKLKTAIKRGNERTNNLGENSPLPKVNIANNMFKIYKHAKQDLQTGKISQEKFDEIKKIYHEEYKKLYPEKIQKLEPLKKTESVLKSNNRQDA